MYWARRRGEHNRLERTAQTRAEGAGGRGRREAGAGSSALCCWGGRDPPPSSRDGLSCAGGVASRVRPLQRLVRATGLGFPPNPGQVWRSVDSKSVSRSVERCKPPNKGAYMGFQYRTFQAPLLSGCGACAGRENPPLRWRLEMVAAPRCSTTVSVAGSSLYVEGERFEVRGVAYSPLLSFERRFEAPPDLFTPERRAVWHDDLQLLAGLGANTLRRVASGKKVRPPPAPANA